MEGGRRGRVRQLQHTTTTRKLPPTKSVVTLAHHRLSLLASHARGRTARLHHTLRTLS